MISVRIIHRHSSFFNPPKPIKKLAKKKVINLRPKFVRVFLCMNTSVCALWVCKIVYVCLSIFVSVYFCACVRTNVAIMAIARFLCPGHSFGLALYGFLLIKLSFYMYKKIFYTIKYPGYIGTKKGVIYIPGLDQLCKNISLIGQ